MNGKKNLEGLHHTKPQHSEEITPKKKNQAALWIRWVAATVCLCLVTTVLLSCRQSGAMEGATENVTQFSPQAGGETQAPTEESSELPTVEGPEIPTRDTIPTPSFGPNPVLRPGNTSFEDVVSLEQVQYMRTNNIAYQNGMSYPMIRVISSRQELEDYYRQYKGRFQLGDDEGGFWKQCDIYNDAFFAEQDLILVLLQENSGSTRHEVQNLGKTEDGTWQILGLRKIPEAGTQDMAQWHILMPIPKNLIAPEDTISLNLTVEDKFG